VEVAGEVALEQAGGVAAGLAFGDPSGDVVRGRCVVLATVQDDRVKCAVELPVAAAAQSVRLCLPARGGERGDAGETGKAGFGAEAAVV
jgi:hypothetical protein